jgi:hypothetical protein
LTKAIPGRPPKVTGEELRWISETVRDQTPWQPKREFGLRALSLIGEIISRQFGKLLTKPSANRTELVLGVTENTPAWRLAASPVSVE